MTRHVVVYRFVVLAVLFGVFDAWDWMPLRVGQRDVAGWSIRVSGYDAAALTHEGSPAIRVAEEIYFYTAECTYFDLLMIVVPFVWVFGASRRSNILRLAIAAVVILGGNPIRTWASVYFNVRGTDWFYTHDLPDYIIWWPTAVIVPLLALRRDLGGRSEPTSKPRVLDTEMSMRADETFASVAEG